MRSARFDVWVAPALTCSEQREKRGGLRQKLYADTWKSHVREVVRQIIQQVLRLMQI